MPGRSVSSLSLVHSLHDSSVCPHTGVWGTVNNMLFFYIVVVKNKINPSALLFEGLHACASSDGNFSIKRRFACEHLYILVGCLTTKNTHAAGRRRSPPATSPLFSVCLAERLKVRVLLCNLKPCIMSAGLLYYAQQLPCSDPQMCVCVWGGFLFTLPHRPTPNKEFFNSKDIFESSFYLLFNILNHEGSLPWEPACEICYRTVVLLYLTDE